MFAKHSAPGRLIRGAFANIMALYRQSKMCIIRTRIYENIETSLMFTLGGLDVGISLYDDLYSCWPGRGYAII